MPAVETKKQTNEKKLANKVAVVTGGSRGIGAAIALRLAEEGATVALTYNKNKKPAEELVQQIKELGGKALAFQAEVTAENDVRKLIDDVVRAEGRIDILVNNAGVFEGSPIDSTTLDQYTRVFDVNIKGVIATTIAALPAIPKGGRIINVSSVVSRKTFPGASIYSASKAALDALTRVWSQDLGAKGITVNGVAPGVTETDMYRAAIPEEARGGLIGKTALGRIGQPDDIAAVVAFLASDDARWVTGQTIDADGGINI